MFLLSQQRTQDLQVKGVFCNALDIPRFLGTIDGSAVFAGVCNVFRLAGLKPATTSKTKGKPAGVGLNPVGVNV
jgi:hypothetical protein